MYFKHNKNNEGYIALVATIIIGAVLLSMSVTLTMASWHTRFGILAIEAKEQSASLAEGCASWAYTLLMTDSSYQGNTTSTIAIGACHIFPLILNSPLEGIVTLHVQGRVRESYTNLEMQIDMKDVRIDTVALPEPVIIPLLPLNFNLHLNSWKELPSLP